MSELLERARVALERSQPYGGLFGFELVEATEEHVRLRMPFRAELTRFNATLHGGAIMSLADTAGVVRASLDARGELAGTMHFSINFLRPVGGGYLDAVARTVHSGQSSLVLETMLEDADGRAVGLVTQTQAVRAAD
ncbi:MAG: PaaI family thioesterase [Chloroflexi bacterium]|nr:PaaI family thioesterase [Chloroflexota bacterium]MDA1147500.1 PaaI family thioesterase [Chloroflexota bacterium]